MQVAPPGDTNYNICEALHLNDKNRE